MNNKDDICCPHCQKPLGIEAVTKAMRETRMSLTMSPLPGEYMSTKAVGGSIQAMGALLNSIGKDIGFKTHTVVESITTDKGEIRVNLIISRVSPTLGKSVENAKVAENV